MSKAWNIDETNFPYLSFGLVSWNMGAAVFPLVFVPLTENTGRMPGYFVSNFPYHRATKGAHEVNSGLIHHLSDLPDPICPGA